jgi:hypothetical protein
MRRVSRALLYEAEPGESVEDDDARLGAVQLLPRQPSSRRQQPISNCKKIPEHLTKQNLKIYIISLNTLLPESSYWTNRQDWNGGTEAPPEGSF